MSLDAGVHSAHQEEIAELLDVITVNLDGGCLTVPVNMTIHEASDLYTQSFCNSTSLPVLFLFYQKKEQDRLREQVEKILSLHIIPECCFIWKEVRKKNPTNPLL